MSDVKIITNETKVQLYSPYHPDCPPAARAIGGKWGNGCWTFDVREEQRVRELAQNVYGYGQETVTIRYTVDDSRVHDVATLTLFGRIIAQRRGRDSRVELGDGVIVHEGRFASSGGSRNNPRISWVGDKIVLEVRDVPVNLIDPDDNRTEILDEMPEESPLASFTDDQLLTEIKRRGLTL